MRLIICPRCQRANPGEAVYCHYDGNLIRPEAVKGTAATALFPNDFVFPSKRRSKSLEDFVQGCQYEWEEACELLKHGDFSRFFALVGRQDLARAARDAEKIADADVALHTFLGALPATQVQGPKLDFKPRRIILDKVNPGEVRQVPVTVLNKGKGLLQGKLTISEGGHWMRPAFGGDMGQCAIKTAREQELLFVVDARSLAAPACYSAKLTIITNGGIAEVPVRLDLGATPFAHAPFKGASTPRDMAERMKANPKAAVPYLENGEVQRWFASNGWNFPVNPIPTGGIALVQQFFEGMGLTRPPTVQVEEPDVSLFCIPPEIVRKDIVLSTPQRKWIYAQAETDSFWLKVLTPTVSGGRRAVIELEIDSSIMDEGQLHHGCVRITTNGGRRLDVRVVVDVQRPSVPFTRRLFGPFFK